MMSIRKTILSAAFVGLGLASGCSSSSSGTGSASSGYKQCPSTARSACTQADIDPYDQCVTAACDTTTRECFGAGYKTGDFSGGACSSWLDCSNRCGCTDTACQEKCPAPADACAACISKMLTCQEGAKCAKPACMAGGSPDSGSPDPACADLQACCDQISDAAQQSTCQRQHDGDPSKCSEVHGSFQAAGLCP
jgi:hypothetical protein